MRRLSKPSSKRVSATAILVAWIASTSLPSLVVVVLLLLHVAPSEQLIVGLVVTTLLWTGVAALRIRAYLLKHVRTLSSLIEAARVQDFSIKAMHARAHGEVGELYRQINALVAKIESEHAVEQEMLGMLRKLVSQMGVAIVACDAGDRIRLLNPTAEKLLKCSGDDLIGTDFAQTPLSTLPLSSEPAVLDFAFPGARGRWQVVQMGYRHHGRPARIVVISDLRQVLASEEIVMWQRLIRVISHEVNNSLTPIISLCQTLEAILSRESSLPQLASLQEGLLVINERAAGLRAFISAYARVARLPEAQRVVFRLSPWADRLRGMFPASQVAWREEVPDVELYGDPVHLEQVLINLIKNAVEANPLGAEPVQIDCAVGDGRCVFQVADNGAGIANGDNLFTPFYTTKPNGAGIGLVLCRSIIARHHGELTLENRSGAAGAVARMTLPLMPPS